MIKFQIIIFHFTKQIITVTFHLHTESPLLMVVEYFSLDLIAFKFLNYKMIVVLIKQMINIPARKLASFENSPAPLLNLLQKCQYTPQDSTNNLATLKVDTKPSYSKVINVRKPQFSNYKQTLEWRAKTEFPIVKVKNWKLLSEKMLGSETQVEILIELEGHFRSLSDYETISFPHSIYVLKESLIGFQRLCYHFGSFHVDQSMIKFNDSGICKVWINKDSYSTEFHPREIESEKDFIIQLCSVIKNQITKSSSAKNFYETIKSCQYFFQAIGAIDLFTKQHLINVPSSVHKLQDCKSPLLKKSLNIFSNQNKQNMAVSSQIPAFLKKNLLKKKNSNETLIPSQKKNLALKKTRILDRSLTNVHQKFSSFMVSKKQSSRVQSFKDQTKQTKSGLKSGMNQFFEGLNIRLIQPNYQSQQNVFSCENLPFLSNKTQINPENQKHVFGQISDIDSSEEHKSGLSIHKIKSHDEKFLDESNPRISVKVTQPKELNGSLLPNHTALFFRHRQSKQFNKKGESNEDFEQNEADSSKLSPQTKQLREKRKYSGNIDSISGKTEEKTPQNSKIKMASFLNSLKNHKSQVLLTKSSSQKIIGGSKMRILIDNENKNKIYLSQTLMIGADFGIDQKNSDEKNLIKTLPETKETSREELKVKAKKLEFLGRQVNESSDTENFQFELKYRTKIKNEKQIRNEIMNILD